MPKEPRFFFKHALKGVYLGNNCWSNDPSGRGINCIPTFSKLDLAAIKGQEGFHELATADEDLTYDVVMRDSTIDMAGDYISEQSAVAAHIVERPWSDPGVI